MSATSAPPRASRPAPERASTRPQADELLHELARLARVGNELDPVLGAGHELDRLVAGGGRVVERLRVLSVDPALVEGPGDVEHGHLQVLRSRDRVEPEGRRPFEACYAVH